MKISEYIAELEKVKEKHGDLDIAERKYTGHSTDVYLKSKDCPSCVLELVDVGDEDYLDDLNDRWHCGDSGGKPTKEYLVLQKDVLS